MNLSTQKDDSLSFEIDDRAFLKPADLIPPALLSLKFRQTLVAQMNNGRLPAWFNHLGKQEWTQAYNEVTKQLADTPDYTTEDQRMAALQVLLQHIEPSLPKPMISSSSETIMLPPAEATGIITSAIFFELQHKGVLKVVLGFNGATTGVSVSEHIIDFNSLTGYTRARILLEIDMTRFPKNKPAAFELIAKTLNGELIIPVHLHPIFPKQAYASTLLKYGLRGLFLFALANWLLSFEHGYAWLPAIAMGFAAGIAYGGITACIKYKLKPVYAILPVLFLAGVLTLGILNRWLY